MIRKGEQVKFKKEWQDDGDDEFVFVAVEDEDRGHVLVVCLNSTLNIKPTQWVRTYMIEMPE